MADRFGEPVTISRRPGDRAALPQVQGQAVGRGDHLSAERPPDRLGRGGEYLL